MPTITYGECNSSFFLKGEEFDLFTEEISDEMRNEFLCSLIHSAIGDPYINRLFINIEEFEPDYERDENGDIILDEDGFPIEKDGYFEYELSYPINDKFDKYFILDVIGYGMLYAWASPLVYSSVNFRQMYGSSGEKFYAQQTHINATEELLQKINYTQRRLIRDRGYSRNNYLDGLSSASRLRGVSS